MDPSGRLATSCTNQSLVTGGRDGLMRDLDRHVLAEREAAGQLRSLADAFRLGLPPEVWEALGLWHDLRERNAR